MNFLPSDKKLTALFLVIIGAMLLTITVNWFVLVRCEESGGVLKQGAFVFTRCLPSP